MNSRSFFLAFLLLFASTSVFAQNQDGRIVNPFWDYTPDGRAYKGRFVDGMTLTPENRAAVASLSLSDLTTLDKSIPWRLSTKTVLESGSSVVAFFNAPGIEGDLAAVPVFKDLTGGLRDRLRDAATKAITRSGKLYLIFTDLSLNRRPALSVFVSAEEFNDKWRSLTDAALNHRYFQVDNLIALTRSPDDAERLRQRTIAQHAESCRPLLDNLKHIHGAALSLAAYSYNTDRMFGVMEAQGIMDDKITSYELEWRSQRERLNNPIRDDALEAYVRFESNLAMAASNTTCTLKVFTSKGKGAQVRAAKADMKYQAIGDSIVTKEIERASYYFESYRGNMKTGDTAVQIDCTGKTQEVTIDEK